MGAAVKVLIEGRLVDLHTCLPGIVEKYDATTKKADIKPAIKRKYIDGDELIDLPVIPNVPMCFYQTKTSLISMPVKVGDDVLIMFSERSIDEWKSSPGGISKDPGDTRKFNLSDAYAIPVCKPLGTGVEAEAEPIYIKNIDSAGRFHEGGQIKFENPIAYVDIGENGNVDIKNAVAQGTLYNAGKIEFKNAISTFTLEATGLNTIKNAAATITEAADGTISLFNASGSIVISSSGTITITTPAGTMTMESSGALNMTSPNAQIDMDAAGKVDLGKATATAINLGAATDFIILGNAFMALYNAHTHAHGTPNTGPPLVGGSGALSAVAKVG